jgi:hypothetical protein
MRESGGRRRSHRDNSNHKTVLLHLCSPILFTNRSFCKDLRRVCWSYVIKYATSNKCMIERERCWFFRRLDTLSRSRSAEKQALRPCTCCITATDSRPTPLLVGAVTTSKDEQLLFLLGLFVLSLYVWLVIIMYVCRVDAIGDDEASLAGRQMLDVV